ncbi:MAG: mannose-1-phosphate guanylyltransferase/mannose-6-phosphate isomerase [Desulfobacterales bacterium]|nr:mannose-1-phosphate guanylyltransferase/mannose-6-phosphate isomerase [Desulfobacterales bacterium]
MPESKGHTYSILLAGGTGTRLWPVSRESFPKQLVKFNGKDSLIQNTIKRLSAVLDTDKIRIVCGKEHLHGIASHMEELGIASDDKIICEPCGRNTAPAILLAAFNILKHEKDAILFVFPADHVIRDLDSFHKKLKSAEGLAEMGYIVTFGIKPDYPETGYGYIEGAAELFDGAFSIKKFVEKPDAETAKSYIEAGNFFWNSGMFAFKLSVIMKEFKGYQPEIYNKIETMMIKEDAITREAYEQIPNISIDYAIMEKTKKGVVLSSDFGWSDIGSWKSLYDFLPKDPDDNVIVGDVITEDTKACLLMGNDRLIATNQVKDMVVVETEDSVFISDLNNSRNVKSIVEKLKKRGRPECQHHKTVSEPWGCYKVLEHKNGFKVSRIVMDPDSILRVGDNDSLVKHLLVIKGQAKITTGEGSRFLKRKESIVLYEKENAEIENCEKEPLQIIEVDIDSQR